MPIYAYKCDACGFTKDVLQKLRDTPLTQCPQCDQPTFKKQVTSAGFQLKGSGWYVTDFRDNGNASKAKSDQPVSAGTTSSVAGATTEAKQAEAKQVEATSSSSASTTQGTSSHASSATPAASTGDGG